MYWAILVFAEGDEGLSQGNGREFYIREVIRCATFARQRRGEHVRPWLLHRYWWWLATASRVTVFPMAIRGARIVMRRSWRNSRRAGSTSECAWWRPARRRAPSSNPSTP